ncbi:roadblock/LC7 domain-containing protein [Actinoplanes siamensis]|uniref:roadblock/LC7 domain-containing protein n=1 Tax=Actinoplanes siamensis TaxID=1223317 RepID=UPI0019419B79
MTVDPAVPDELGRLRSRVPELVGSVLATADGMVVAHDSHGIEPDTLAALAAAHLALARRFAHAVNHGELRESVVECDGGYITSYTAGPNALLTVVTSGDANLAMVHLEARRCVRRIVKLLAQLELIRQQQKQQQLLQQQHRAQSEHQPPQRPEIPQQTGPSTAPLVRRTPMATLPNVGVHGSLRHTAAG